MLTCAIKKKHLKLSWEGVEEPAPVFSAGLAPAASQSVLYPQFCVLKHLLQLSCAVKHSWQNLWAVNSKWVVLLKQSFLRERCRSRCFSFWRSLASLVVLGPGVGVLQRWDFPLGGSVEAPAAVVAAGSPVEGCRAPGRASVWAPGLPLAAADPCGFELWSGSSVCVCCFWELKFKKKTWSISNASFPSSSLLLLLFEVFLMFPSHGCVLVWKPFQISPSAVGCL